MKNSFLSNKIIFNTLLLVVIFLTSCATSGTLALSSDASIISLDGPIENVRCEFIKKIPLKTIGNDVIGQVTNVIYRNERFYIFDRRQNIIWQFDKNGTFKNKLAAIGPGPGEYASIRSFDVTDDGLLYILDCHKRKINAYDADDLSFKSSIPLKYLSADMGVIDKDNIFVGNTSTGWNKREKLSKLEENGTNLHQILGYRNNDEYNLTSLGSTRFYRSGDGLVYYDRFSDAVYELNNDSICQILTIKSSKLPTDKQIEELIENTVKDRDNGISASFNYGENNNVIWDITDIYFTPSWIYMTPQTRPLQHMFIDRKTNEVYEAIIDKEHLKNFSRCRIGAIGVCEDNFITLQSSEDEESDYSLVLFSLKKI